MVYELTPTIRFKSGEHIYYNKIILEHKRLNRSFKNEKESFLK